ncbi:MAG: PAS domain-containing protein [Steroidobacteraceae bacterium]|nr:PAS domain-containing protein [Steroidobacteraceae bacterium]
MSAIAPESPTRVFVVEDEALIAMELRDRLTDLGYVVMGTASRGEQALEAIPACAPDVVLMDVRLAGTLTGIETAARLRPHLDVPIIFLSAYSDAELLREAGEVLPFGYLVKPFEERELHATIQMALYKHRMERELRESHARLEEKVRERTAELARSRENLAVTLDSIGEAVVATNAAGNIMLMNPAAEDLTEWAQHEALGAPVVQVVRLVSEQTGDTVPIPLRIVLATGQRQFLPNNTVLLTRIGGERKVSGSTAPIRDAGRIVGVILVLRDETDARRGYEQQRDNREFVRKLSARATLFESLAELAPVGIVRTDIGGRCTYANPKYCEMTGFTHDQLIGSDWLAPAIHEADRLQVLGDWERARELGEPFQCDCRLVRGDEQIVFVLAQAVPVRDRSGTPSGYISTLTDVSVFHRGETDLQPW